MISVIVPVYNVETYLKRCVDSLISQTYKDYEIILVDDGSSDSSGAICDEYAQKNSNICAIHKENAGLSDTRNVGIHKAKGEYVTYVDSDDVVTNDYLEVLFSGFDIESVDMSVARFHIFTDNNDLSTLNKDNKTYKTRIYEGKEACYQLLYEKDFQTSACNILIKKEIALNNLFPVGKYHEDELTTFRYMLASRKAVITDKELYYYYQRPGSIMHTFGKPVMDEVDAANNYTEVLKNFDSRLQKAAKHKKYSLLKEVIINYPELENKNPDLYYDVIHYLKENSIEMLFDLKASLGIKKFIIKYFLLKIKR